MKFLVCDISGEMHGRIQESNAVVVNNPVQCLNQAIIGHPNAVVVCFGNITLGERDALIELCRILQQNQYTRDIGTIALLYSKHRVVMEQIRDAGVEYVKFLARAGFLKDSINVTTIEPEPEDRVTFQLAILCPYLHYSQIDSRRELTVCGAYLDRMVLGGRRLQEICETQGHSHCEYYLNPRCSA
ncbi:MAG: hypothetical protein K9K63_11290 [Desulfotignum sp.]|nr:hypothetical protein [Desulfotignum sp.]MCF8137883.1 hypothetical protein [Desulfotignum sp.]